MLEDNVAMLRGSITRYDITCLNSWIRSVEIGEQAGTLLIDSPGGISDPETLVNMVRAPIHTHVLNEAHSFAALIAMCGSFKTAVEDAIIMVHASKWKQTKTAGEVARDQSILDTFNYRVMSVMGSVLPAGDAKDQISKAMCSDLNHFFDVERLYETGVLDRIAEFTPNLKCKETESWIRRTYYD